MSKGHGAAQRFVLDQLQRRLNGQSIYDLARGWMHHKAACGCEPPEFSTCDCRPIPAELQSIRRAVRTLEREGRVETWWAASLDGTYKMVRLR
jgi:hypothetical protein